ncbi:MAG: enolase C-terminal domain-like protein, partial [Bryobacteraceae bacterium]
RTSMAEARKTRPVSWINTLNGIATTAALHFWVSTHYVRYPQEYDYNTSEPDHGLAMVTNPVLPKNGFLTPPDGSGIGVELNRAEVAKLAAKSL